MHRALLPAAAARAQHEQVLADLKGAVFTGNKLRMFRLKLLAGPVRRRW
jgi:hypothetical protein